MLKSGISQIGGKFRLRKQLLNFVPYHEYFLSLFCGSCVFELNKPKARFCTRCGNGMSLVAIKTNEENQRKAVAFAELFNDVPSEEMIKLIKKYKES